jgi:hypothetical protein
VSVELLQQHTLLLVTVAIRIQHLLYVPIIVSIIMSVPIIKCTICAAAAAAAASLAISACPSPSSRSKHSATALPKFLQLEQQVLSQLVQYGQMLAPCVRAFARAFEGHSTIG